MKSDIKNMSLELQKDSENILGDNKKNKVDRSAKLVFLKRLFINLKNKINAIKNKIKLILCANKYISFISDIFKALQRATKNSSNKTGHSNIFTLQIDRSN